MNTEDNDVHAIEILSHHIDVHLFFRYHNHLSILQSTGHYNIIHDTLLNILTSDNAKNNIDKVFEYLCHTDILLELDPNRKQVTGILKSTFIRQVNDILKQFSASFWSKSR